MEIQTRVLIALNLIYDVILGTSTLPKINVVINFKNNTLTSLVNNTTHKIVLGNNYEQTNYHTDDGYKLIKPTV